MLVMQHGKREPRVAVTTRAARGEEPGRASIQAYLGRWTPEKSCGFSTQDCQLGGHPDLTLQRFAEPGAASPPAWALLAAYQAQVQPLISQARRQKPRSRPAFPYVHPVGSACSPPSSASSITGGDIRELPMESAAPIPRPLRQSHHPHAGRNIQTGRRNRGKGLICGVFGL